MKNRIIIAALCLFASGTLSAQSVYPGQHRGKIWINDIVPILVGIKVGLYCLEMGMVCSYLCFCQSRKPCLMLTLKSNNDEEFCLYPTSLSILAFNRMR